MTHLIMSERKETAIKKIHLDKIIKIQPSPWMNLPSKINLYL
jgi:hypothetical protein